VLRTLLVIGALVALPLAQPPATPQRDPAIYGHINHLGWIVTDLDAVTRAWRNFGVTGIQDPVVLEIPIAERGQTSGVRVRRATAQIGSLAIHWIQPLGASDVFTSFLASHGEGVHHIAFEVPSAERLDEELRSLQAAGLTVTHDGTFSTPAGPLRFAYLDTASSGGGITLELEYNPATARAPAAASTPHEDPFNRVTQVAFVVRDLEAVSAYWARAGFGAIPFARNVSLDRVYRGQPGRFEMLLGFTRTSDIPLEWIQPLIGPSVYEEYVAAHREGVHHLGFNVSDFDAAVSRLAGRGLNVTMSGRWDNDGSQGRFAYVDAERHGGVTIELLWNKPAPDAKAAGVH
jgi:catechol 2,3-dioxygenase-like lactoylglutathione lyase family enzyme